MTSAVTKNALQAILLAAVSRIVHSLVDYQHSLGNQARIRTLLRVRHRLVIVSRSRISCIVSVATNALLARNRDSLLNRTA